VIDELESATSTTTPIDDQRPRPPPTTWWWTADAEYCLKLPLQEKMRRSTYSRQRLMCDLSRARTLVECRIVAQVSSIVLLTVLLVW